MERKRGCGYRKVGGLYLMGGGIGIPCDRLPFELTVCPCCSQGVKQARGWTWIDVAKFFQGPHMEEPQTLCSCGSKGCPLCLKPEILGKAGLLWIGEKFYKTPSDFLKEGVALGFSRRIKAVPQGFKIGETWVLLAHAKAVPVPPTVTTTFDKDPEFKPGIFYVWLPQRLELCFKESERGSEKVQAAEKRGITAVFFPDSDVDHQGNVHDDFEAEKKRTRTEAI
jgi:hypothetical protein